MSFAVNQEIRVGNILQKLVAHNLSEETRRSLKQVGPWPGLMYRLWKVHKEMVDIFPPFRPILQ